MTYRGENMLDASSARFNRRLSQFATSITAAGSVAALLIAIALFSLNKTHYTTRTTSLGSSYPVYRRDAVLRVVSLNVHAGLDAAGNDRVDAIAQLLSELNPDLVGLQEVRRNDPATRRVPQDVVFSSKTGMVALFQPLVWLLGPVQGNAVLSRAYPLAENSMTVAGRNERRGILLISIKLGETEVDFINVHLGLSRPERSEQVQAIVDLVTKRNNPAIIAGDFNVSPDSEELLPLAAIAREAWDAALVRHGTGYTFPAANPTVRIDQIWVYGPLEALEAQVIAANVSDHLPVMATIRLKPLF
mgnify:FL=1